MKSHQLTLFLTGLFLPLTVITASPHNLSATAILATDYMHRGVSQTDNSGTIQFGLDYAHESGIIAGLFLSNVDYNSDTHREQDIYLGYATRFANGLSINGNVLFIGYQNESELNYTEYTVGAAYKWLNARYQYANDYSGTGGSGEYFEAGITVPINNDFTLGARAGHSNFDSTAGINDYNNYSLSISTFYNNFGMRLTATKTDDNQFGDLGESRIVFGIYRTFTLIP